MRVPDVFKIGSVWVGVRVELCTTDLGMLQIKLPSLEPIIVHVIHNTYTSVQVVTTQLGVVLNFIPWIRSCVRLTLYA